MGKYLMRSPLGSRVLWFALSLSTIAALLLGGCGGTSTVATQPSPTATAQSSPTLSITTVAVVPVKIVQKKDGNYAFDPAMLMVKVRTQVIWTNDTKVPHTVTSDTNAFNSDYLNNNQTFSMIFTRSGAYKYYCNFHPYMQGAVLVTG